MPDVALGKEEEFRYLQRWLAVSGRADRLIEASERQGNRHLLSVPAPAPSPTAVSRPRGLRAAFASGLARLALAVHREAAAGAGLRPEAESPP